MNVAQRKVLEEQLVALRGEHSQTHRRMMDALQTDNLLGLIEASRVQGDICARQGALLADYVATVISTMPDIDPVSREQIRDLARRLRESDTRSAAN